MKKIIDYLRKIPLYWCLLWLFFYCSFGALGFPILTQTFGIFRPVVILTVQAALLATTFYLLRPNRFNKWFLSLIILYFLISWIYLPQAIMYGPMSMGIIASLFETNSTETLEYLQSFPWYVYLIWLSYLFFFIFLLKINNKKPYHRKNLAWLFFCIALTFTWAIKNPLSFWVKKEYRNETYLYTYLISTTSFRPFQFIISTVYHIQLYLEEKRIMDLAFNHPPSWQILSYRPKYQNYILIIGESMRKDYMSLYGYPFNNTTFLEKTNGIIFQNYVAAAPNTQVSLSRTLYRTNKKGDIIYTDNIISLAKQAKIKIYWLSNQGRTSKHDTAASRLAKHADEMFFTQKMDFKEKTFDIALLPELEKILSVTEKQPRLIVLHLMGSHNLFCDRLPDKSNMPKLINENMSCYLQSINQTDKLISDVNDMLRQVNQSYTVIYFSDHGLSKHEKFTDGMWANNKYKQNYQIPFIRFDSDSTNRTIIHSPKSAFDFINGFAEWLGIEEKTLSQQPSFFEDKPNGKIRVFNWHEMVDFDSLEDDPPLPPTPYK
ncbi:phosphoethanolamine transferase [Conchiformibius steedae]|uniref:Sulfatase N-terminal domain-containing protein n=1 Tax=Conchiformibius steedae TaxID=153493 RepID=A0A3P2A840_9NEIS|nr:phosphoethanolamine transferase [Conchiformibius steedae]RRD91662.1 hypothetical protein EII21_01160 [Conchiformibius steedae]